MVDHTSIPSRLRLSVIEWQVVQHVLQGASIDSIEEALGLEDGAAVRLLRSAIGKLNKVVGDPFHD